MVEDLEVGDTFTEAGVAWRVTRVVQRRREGPPDWAIADNFYEIERVVSRAESKSSSGEYRPMVTGREIVDAIRTYERAAGTGWRK